MNKLTKYIEVFYIQRWKEISQRKEKKQLAQTFTRLAPSNQSLKPSAISSKPSKL